MTVRDVEGERGEIRAAYEPIQSPGRVVPPIGCSRTGCHGIRGAGGLLLTPQGRRTSHSARYQRSPRLPPWAKSSPTKSGSMFRNAELRARNALVGYPFGELTFGRWPDPRGG
jgi:hypothetical protein